MGAWFATILLGALALLLVLAGIEDARRREIANWKNAAIAALAPLWWVANGLPLWPDIAIQFGIALAILLLFAGAFAIGQMGGGDVKLIAALALWLPLQPLLWMVMLMALLGGALTLIMLGEQWVRRGAAIPRVRPVVAVAALALAACTAALWLGLPAEPMLWLLTFMALLGCAGVLLLVVVRGARRRGMLPETPYGVAIAIAALLVLREPILNQFG